MKKSIIAGLLVAATLSAVAVPAGRPVPATYIMVCCHAADKGTKFLANGAWDAKHDYGDYAFAVDQMRKIKEAGINVVGIDFTNPSQWDQFKARHWPMLLNVVKAARELDMQYFLFLGNTCAHTMKYWNEKAKIVWEEFAQDPHYRRYGFGDDRPMMTIFLPGKDFAAHLKRSKPEEKNWLEKFRIGTCQVNDPIVPTPTDGWGYRNKSAGSTDLARFVAPNSGVAPKEWSRVDAKEWRARVKWALGAKEYAVIGTYDDTCDCIFWGIADVRGARNPIHVHESTKDDPYAYYNIVKEEIGRFAAPGAANACGVSFPEPASFNPSWESAKPGTSLSTDLPTGALLGNGSLGAVNGGDGNHKHFVLTRGDIWSCGDFTCGGADNNVRPISFADFSIGPGMRSVKSTDTLDLPTAMLRTMGGFGKGRVRLETYVASTEDLLIVVGVSDADDDWAVHLTAHNERKSFPIEAKSSKDAFYVRRSTINLLPKGDSRGWTTNATAALSVLGAELGNFSTTDGRRATAWAKICANVPFAFVVSSDPARRFTWEELAWIRAAHVTWWKGWWARSRVATGDADLDRFYYGQVYLLGAGVRSGKFPPGLYGIWVTTDNPKWHNDFHMNYNYVGTYYGCFAANRCEVADTMPDPLIAYLPQAIRNAKEVVPNLDTCKGRRYKNTRAYLDSHPDVANGIDDAAFYPVALGPWGTSAEGEDSHWSQVSDGAFQCAVMCTHWEYTLDRAYLKKVWPVLDKTANFFLKWCEKEVLATGGYRYNVWDSHWEGSGLAKNSAPALGCVRHIFETLVDVAPVLREMGIDVSEAKLAAWKDMHEHLAELPVGVYPIDGKPVKMLSGVENADGSANPSGGNALNLESVIPGEQFAFDVTPEFRALAVGAVDGNIAKSPTRVWTCPNQTPKLFAMAIRAGYPAQAIIDAFKTHQLSIMQKNFHIHDGVHGVEKIGAMEFVQSMLIQCDHGFVKVFPNWTGADAKFENLRAKGGFLVSAELKGGKVVRVEVKSKKGGRFRLVDPRTPRDRRSPPPGWTRGCTRNSGEPTLERDFVPGETAYLDEENSK